MAARMMLGATVMAAVLGAGMSASAQAPAAFGPVSDRAFHFKSGTSIERAGKDCQNNSDWLILRGPGLASAKSLDISPRTQNWDKQSFQLNACSGPDCYQVFVKVNDKDAPGPRTVTLTHADGRKVTTTFDVIENAGRCDYPTAKK